MPHVEYFGQSLKAALSRRINMVTFANLGSVHLPSLKFVGVRVRKIRHIQCVSCLSMTVSQLFEPQLQKIVIFTYPGLHFCLPWGRPQDNHAKRCMNEKTIQCLPNPSQHIPVYLQQFPIYSNRKCKKNRRFPVPQPTFLFLLETPLRLSRNMLHGWKDNSMLAKLLTACTHLSSKVSELYDA